MPKYRAIIEMTFNANDAADAQARSEWTIKNSEDFSRARLMTVVEVGALEPCTNGPCRSPVACSGFGYCRERNMGASTVLSGSPTTTPSPPAPP